MNKLYAVASLVILASCHRSTENITYKTRDYLTVGKMMDTIKPPYIVDAHNGTKRVVLMGCDHNRDPDHPQFASIERYFNELKPQVTFNEGGQVADSIHFTDVKDAVLKHGETGVLKYLSDRAHIRMMDGDMADSVEFKIMLKKYPKDSLLLYYVMERMVIPYLNGAYGKMPFETFYSKAMKKWFVEPGFPLDEKEQSFDHFKDLYRKFVGEDFKLEMNKNIERFDYVNGGNCAFCALGRASKMARDSGLLSKIDKALDTHDRVMVTFGHGHALAIEPALRQIVAKQR
jgi:hypothetical protein